MELLAALVADIHVAGAGPHRLHGRRLQYRAASEWPTSRRVHGGAGLARRGELRAGQPRRLCAGLARRAAARPRPLYAAATTAEAPLSVPAPARAGRPGRAFVGDPTLPFVASGRMGATADQRRPRVLAELGRDPHCFRFVMIHHPPHVGGAQAGRNLTDAQAFEAMIARGRRGAGRPRPQPCRLARLLTGARRSEIRRGCEESVCL